MKNKGFYVLTTIVLAAMFCLNGCKKDHVEYYADNQTIKKVYYTDGDNGPLIGEYKEFRSNGDLQEIRNYKKGLLDGKYFYLWKGDTILEKNYKFGKIDGKQYAYWYKVSNSPILDSIQEYNYKEGKYLPNVKLDSFLDVRDSVSYKIISVGKKTYFAENLKYKGERSYCYSGKDENCEKYGRLYTKQNVRQVCPEGWTLLSQFDFVQLAFLSMGVIEFENKVKKNGEIYIEQKIDGMFFGLRGSFGWKKPEWKGSDILGFNILPSGYYCPNGVYNFYSGKKQYSFEEGSFALMWYVDDKGKLQPMLLSPQNLNVECGGAGNPIALPVRCMKINE